MLNASWKALSQLFPSAFTHILHPKLESCLNTKLDWWASTSLVHPQSVLQRNQEQEKCKEDLNHTDVGCDSEC